jgi:hypothetical protein
MAEQQLPRPNEEAGTGAENTPPGATRQALDRPRNPRAQSPNKDAEKQRTIDDPKGGEKGRSGRSRKKP